MLSDDELILWFKMAEVYVKTLTTTDEGRHLDVFTLQTKINRSLMARGYHWDPKAHEWVRVTNSGGKDVDKVSGQRG